MPGTRQPLRSTLAVLVGALLFACLLEGGLRLLGARFLLAQQRHNRAAAAQVGAIGVLCVGDSMTAGQYPLFLEAALEARLPDRDFAVYDAGRPSTNSWYVLRRIEGWLERYEPRIVVAMLGFNDSGRALPYRLATPDRGLLPWERLRAWKLTRLAASRLGEAPEPGAQGTPPFELTRELYPRLAELLAQRDITLLAMQYPTLPAGPLRELLAEQPGLLVLDNQELFAQEPDPWSTIYVDRFGGSFGHLSERGNTMLAERIAAALAEGAP